MVSIEKKLLDTEQWIKLRASTDGKQSFLTWQGSIFSLIEGEPKKHLFDIVGMSVARCIPKSKGWGLTSRELTFYLDPTTGKKLEKWQNPWTQEELTVVHVANDPIQGEFLNPIPALVGKEWTTYKFDLFPYYKNPLADDPKFTPYSPQPMYQATELFQLTVPTKDLQDPSLTSISQVILVWDRIGLWLPWMKMGDHKGYLVYSAWGERVASLADLPPLLQTEINNRVPLFKNAPDSLSDQKNMSSWHYFKKHFNAYLRGETFPISQ